jgi:hypothetical protein
MTGRVLDSGWEDSGLPVDEGQPAGRAYRDLVERADGAA